MDSIQSVRKEDVAIITKIHLASFQGFFLSYLGAGFLLEFYESIRVDSSGIFFVYRTPDGSVAGSVAGTDQISDFYKRLIRKRWWRFGWAATPAFLKKPSILPRLLRAFTLPCEPLPAPKCGTLMSIGIDPKYQGRGYGRELVNAFLNEAVGRGCEYVNLTTDAICKDAVNAFYRHMGFDLFRSYITPEGRKMNEYLIKLSK